MQAQVCLEEGDVKGERSITIRVIFSSYNTVHMNQMQFATVEIKVSFVLRYCSLLMLSLLILSVSQMPTAE